MARELLKGYPSSGEAKRSRGGMPRQAARFCISRVRTMVVYVQGCCLLLSGAFLCALSGSFLLLLTRDGQRSLNVASRRCGGLATHRQLSSQDLLTKRQHRQRLTGVGILISSTLAHASRLMALCAFLRVLVSEHRRVIVSEHLACKMWYEMFPYVL